MPEEPEAGVPASQPEAIIHTPRLDLPAATAALMRAALAGAAALASQLGANPPGNWPLRNVDDAMLRHFLARLEHDPGQANWGLRFVLRRGDGAPPTLIGVGGFKGPPGPDGLLEVGFSIADDHLGQGYGTEVVQALVALGLALTGVTGIVAHTLPADAASMHVLLKNGFRRSQGHAPLGAVRFELPRARLNAQTMQPH